VAEEHCPWCHRGQRVAAAIVLCSVAGLCLSKGQRWPQAGFPGARHWQSDNSSQVQNSWWWDYTLWPLGSGPSRMWWPLGAGCPRGNWYGLMRVISRHPRDYAVGLGRNQQRWTGHPCPFRIHGMSPHHQDDGVRRWDLGRW
jgi:hypothetical protein